MELRGDSVRVVVTGSTGFIGGRLIEVLAGCRGVNVTALVRDFSKVARVARLGVPLVRADLLQPASFASTLKNADVVFHCGYGGSLDERAERTMNLEGTVNLAKEALRQGVHRFVHVSSMSIYGHDLPPVVTEATPPKPTTRYGQIKLDIEQALAALAGTSGLDVRMVRPTKVFGPYDYNFTVPTAQRLVDGRLWLIEGGTGIVSPNYVDNLVQGLLLCAEKEGLKGSAYIMADGVSLTWAEFYRHFSKIAGTEPCGSVTHAECAAATAAARKPPTIKALLDVTLLSKEARALYPKHPLLRTMREYVPQGLVNRFKGRPAPKGPSLVETAPRVKPPLPSMNEYRDYVRRGAYSIALAEQELGYRPAINLETAMARTGAWLRFADVVPHA